MTLNTEYVLNIFTATRDATAQGSFAIVPEKAPEVVAMVKAKYIKLSKKLHNADGNVGATLVDGATEADLRVDFEIPDFPQAAEAPEAPVAAPEAPAAPTLQAPVAEAPVAAGEAPFSDVIPAAEPQPEFQAMNTQIEETTPVSFDAPVAPVFESAVGSAVQPEAVNQVATAPVTEQGDVKLIGDSAYDVATVVPTRSGEVEIEVGVPFTVKVTKAEQRKQNAGLEHHPYSAIAEFKLANPTSTPSFHVADKELKDMSSSIKRANARFEKEGSQVTFRAQRADENDPKGAGVRVYALFVSEAPAQRTVRRKKDEDTAAE